MKFCSGYVEILQNIHCPNWVMNSFELIPSRIAGGIYSLVPQWKIIALRMSCALPRIQKYVLLKIMETYGRSRGSSIGGQRLRLSGRHQYRPGAGHTTHAAGHWGDTCHTHSSGRRVLDPPCWYNPWIGRINTTSKAIPPMIDTVGSEYV